MRMQLQLALRNTRRNTRRSLLTATMITLGVALLTVALAWVDGVLGGALDTAAANVGAVRVAHADYARREALMPLASNLPETAPLEAKLREVPGVTAVVPRITMPVTLSADETLGERFARVQGAPWSYYAEQLDLDAKLTAGGMPEAEDEALVGAYLAEQLKIAPGAEIVLLGQTQDGSLAPAKVTVTGIVDLGNAQQERQVWASLERVRWMADIPAGATEILVHGPPRDDARELARLVRERLGAETSSVVEAWDERPPFDQLLSFITAIHTVAGGVIVFITALGVFNTMLMSVLERTSEIGVLRALGMRRREVVVVFLLEAGMIAVGGGVLGVILGGLAGWWLQEVGVDLGSAVDRLNGPIAVASVLHARVRASTLLGGFGLGLLMAIAGGLLPAFRASRVPPVEAMRARR